MKIILSAFISFSFLLFACEGEGPNLERSLEKINRKLDEKLGNVDSLINKNIERIDSIVKDKLDSILIK